MATTLGVAPPPAQEMFDANGLCVAHCLLCVWSFGLSACSDPGPLTGQRAAAIKGGTGDVQGEHPAAALLHMGHAGSVALCSGVFIAPRMVLTAKHCFPCPSMGEGEGCYDPQTETAKDGPIFWWNHAVSEQVKTGYYPYTQGTSHHATYVWFAAPDAFNPDLAVVRTAEPLTGVAVAPLLAGDPQPGETVRLLGYSDKTFSQGDQYRRWTTGTVGATAPVDGGAALGEGVIAVQPATSTHVCKGDSGGPVFFSRNGQWHVGAVISTGQAGEDECGLPGAPALVQRISRGFLDALCKHGSWEDCVARQGDSDEDGIPDSSDNCPENPNVEQTNTNGLAADALLYPAIRPGDACDHMPAVSLVDRDPGEAFGWIEGVDQHVSGTVAAGMVFSGVVKQNSATIHYRRPGYAVRADLYFPDHATANERQDALWARYCACHDPTSTDTNPKPTSNSVCYQLAYCPHAGFTSLTPDYATDTGWLPLNWRVAATGEVCEPADPDGNGNANECEQAIPDAPSFRPFGATTYCTERNEFGCNPKDVDRFWRQAGKTGVLAWPWRSQDYPHPTGTSYTASNTPLAKVRVWLRPGHASYSSLDAAHQSAFSLPQTLEWGLAASLSKPVYELPRWRWVLPPWADPLGDRKRHLWLLAPIDRDSPAKIAPLALNWNVELNELMASRGIVSSAVRTLDAHLGQAEASQVLGAMPDHALHTTGFAATQASAAVFVFGGYDARGELSDALWFGGLPDGGDIERDGLQFERLDGGALMAMLAAAPTASGASSKPPPSKPATPRFGSWKAAQPKGKARSSVALIAAGALAKHATSKTGTSTAASSTTLRTLSATQDPPEPQASGAIAYSSTWATLTVLHGDRGDSPTHGDPVQLAVFDLESQQWTRFELDWSEGGEARRLVGYTQSSPTQLLFFGGERDGDALDGLYRLDLNPELIASGEPPLRLDEEGATAPSPRTLAALAFDPLAGKLGAVLLYGGRDSNGQPLGDLWRFDLSTNSWTRLSDGSEEEAPPAALAAGIFIKRLDGSIVVVAGNGTRGTTSWAHRFVVGQRWQRVDPSVAEQ